MVQLRKALDLSIEVMVYLCSLLQINDKGYRTLEEGQIVEFDLCETERGLQAHNVIKTLN